MPAEWERHDATWLSWPKNPLTFPEDIIESVEEIYCKMVTPLSYGEKVKILVDDEGAERRAAKRLERHGASMKNVLFLRIKSADVWIRDYGPIFLLSRKTGGKAVVKFTFNAWGEKYDDLMYDNITGEEIVKSLGLPTFRPNIVLEGGSVDVNGLGTVLTTEQCLLNKNRNPHLTKQDREISGRLPQHRQCSMAEVGDRRSDTPTGPRGRFRSLRRPQPGSLCLLRQQHCVQPDGAGGQL